MLGLKSPSRKSFSSSLNKSTDMENSENHHINIMKSPGVIKGKSPLVSSHKRLSLEELGRTPQSQKKAAKEKKNKHNETADVSCIGDLLNITNESFADENSNGTFKYHFEATTLLTDGLSFLGNDNRRETFSGDVNGLLEASNTSDLLDFAEASHFSFRKSCTSDRRETVDATNLESILGDLESGDMSDTSVRLLSTGLKKNSTPGRRETMDAADLNDLLNNLSSSNDSMQLSDGGSPRKHHKSTPNRRETLDSLGMEQLENMLDSVDGQSSSGSIRLSVSSTTSHNSSYLPMESSNLSLIPESPVNSVIESSPVVTRTTSSRESLSGPSTPTRRTKSPLDVETPTRKSPRLAARSTPTLVTDSDVSSAINNSLTSDLSNGSSLFAGFHNRDERRQTADEGDMRDLLASLADDEEEAQTTDHSLSVTHTALNASTDTIGIFNAMDDLLKDSVESDQQADSRVQTPMSASGVSEGSAANSPTNMSMMSDLSMVSDVSSIASSVKSVAPQKRRQSTRSGVKSKKFTAKQQRRQTADLTQMQSLKHFVDNEHTEDITTSFASDSAGFGFSTNDARRQTVDSVDMAALMEDLEQASSLNASTMSSNVSTDSNDTFVLRNNMLKSFEDTVIDQHCATSSDVRSEPTVSSFSRDTQEVSPAENTFSEDDEGSVGTNGTMDARGLFNESTDTIDTVNTVDTFALMENLHDILEDSALNTSDMTCGTVGSLGGLLAEAEEAAEHLSELNQSNLKQHTRDSLGLALSKKAKSAPSPVGPNKNKRLSIRSSRQSLLPSVMESPNGSERSFVSKANSGGSGGKKKKRPAVLITKSTTKVASVVPVQEEHTMNFTTSFNTSALMAPPSALKSCMSSRKAPRHNNMDSVSKRSVVFGSPNVAEFNKLSPTTNYTPLDRKQAKTLFSMHSDDEHDNDISRLTCTEEETEDQRITRENQEQLDNWDRLSYASGSGGESSDDESTVAGSVASHHSADLPVEEEEGPFSSNSAFRSNKKSRRRNSKIQPLMDLDHDEEEPEFTNTMELNTRDVVPAFLDTSAFSDCTNTVNLPRNLADLMDQNDVMRSPLMPIAAAKKTVNSPAVTAADRPTVEAADMFESSRDLSATGLEEAEVEVDLDFLMRGIERSHSYLPSSQVSAENECELSLHELSHRVEDDSRRSSSEDGSAMMSIMKDRMVYEHDSEDLSGEYDGGLANLLPAKASAPVSTAPVVEQRSVMEDSRDLSVMSAADDNTMAIHMRHQQQEMSGVDSSCDMTANLENNLDDLVSYLTSANAAERQQSLGTPGRSQYVDDEISIIVRGGDDEGEQSEDDADNVETDEEPEQQEHEEYLDEAQEEEVDISTATTLVDDNSALRHDLSAVMMADEQENFPPFSQHQMFSRETSFSDNNVSAVKSNTAEEIKERLRNIREKERRISLAQAATPVVGKSSRLSMAHKRKSFLPHMDSAVKSVSKKRRVSSLDSNRSFAAETNLFSATKAPINLLDVSSQDIVRVIGAEVQSYEALNRELAEVMVSDTSALLAESIEKSSALVQEGPFSRSDQSADVSVAEEVAEPEAEVSMVVDCSASIVEMEQEEVSVAAEMEQQEEVSVSMNDDTVPIFELSNLLEAEVQQESSASASCRLMLSSNLSKYFAVVQAVRSVISSHSTEVQSAVVTIMKDSMRASHQQCHATIASIPFSQLETAWAMSADMCDEFIQSTMALEAVSSAVVVEEDEMFSVRIADWDQFWVNISAIAILEHVDALKSCSSGASSAKQSADSSVGGEDKFFAKALNNSSIIPATARKAKQSSQSTLVLSGSESVSTGAADSSKAEAIAAMERRTQYAKKLTEVTNKLTHCRVVTYNSECILVKAMLSSAVHATIKFNLRKSAAATGAKKAVLVVEDNIEIELVLPSRSVENLFVAGYFASVLCSKELNGPFNQLDGVDSPAQIPAALQKISAGIATLRSTLVAFKQIASSGKYPVSMRRVSEEAEDEVVLEVVPGKYLAVQTVRSFVANRKEATDLTKHWAYETVGGENVSAEDAEKVLLNMPFIKL